MLAESCVIFFCPPEPFKALFCEVIYRPVEREREKGEGFSYLSGIVEWWANIFLPFVLLHHMYGKIHISSHT